MTVVATAAGAVLIAAALRDIFETLFQPGGRGEIGMALVRVVPRAVAVLTRRRSTRVSGPMAFVAVIGTWTLMLVLGWALVFWPQMPEGFSFDRGLDPAEHDGFLDALYVSLVNVTSLGYGDIAPEAAWLRILGPIETIFGLALVTASISWLVSIYAVLGRRRALAHEARLARDAEEAMGAPLARLEPDLCERIVTTLTTQLVMVRRDLIHFPIGDAFGDERVESLETVLPFLRRLAKEGSEAEAPHGLRVRANMLGRAIDDYEHAHAQYASPVR